jgi:2-keto-3-deoxy-L-fuconate dehydrogenase
MSNRLDGKLALITGSGQGIGRAIAESFLGEGCRVIATDIDVKKLAGLSQAKCLPLDVRSTSAIESLSKDLAREGYVPDVLVNCAGYVHQGTVLECPEDVWDFSFDLNVKSMHRTIRAFLPGMLKLGHGSIVNISSTVSSLHGVPNRYAYGATKASVIGLTKAVAADFIKNGIRANAVCPGTIETPSLGERITEVSTKSGKSRDAARDLFVERQPMGRLGTAQEVAWFVVFLASDESSFVTGQTHIVDGGMAM